MCMRPLGGLALVVRTAAEHVVDADLLDDQDLVLDVDLALSL